MKIIMCIVTVCSVVLSQFKNDFFVDEWQNKTNNMFTMSSTTKDYNSYHLIVTNNYISIRTNDYFGFDFGFDENKSYNIRNIMFKSDIDTIPELNTTSKFSYASSNDLTTFELHNIYDYTQIIKLLKKSGTIKVLIEQYDGQYKLIEFNCSNFTKTYNKFCNSDVYTKEAVINIIKTSFPGKNHSYNKFTDGSGTISYIDTAGVSQLYKFENGSQISNMINMVK